MVAFCIGLFKSVRPRQWIKNLAVFAALIFTGEFFNPDYFVRVFAAFLIFNAVSSAMYLINDVMDRERDRQHPFKRLRPIARGVIPIPLALAIAFGTIVVSLPIAFSLSPHFFSAVVMYLLLQAAYSALLKHIILIDVIAIALGFTLRVYAGVWVLPDAHLSVWFFLTVLSAALFIAVGKRRSELTLLGAHAPFHREILSHYPPTLLESLTTMFATAAWVTYAIFAFQIGPLPSRRFVINIFEDFLAQPIEQTKWMMLTVPIVIYGIMRYLYIIYEKRQGESPDRVLLSDLPLLATAAIWVLSLIGIIYGIGK